VNENNLIVESNVIRGVQAYVYAFKARAQRHHCLGYGTWTVDFATVERLRREYSRTVSPITYVPIYVKATAMALARNPEANAILFKTWYGSRRIVRFARVDVNLPIIRTVDGELMTFIGTIRDAASKTLQEIQAELTEYHRCDPEASFSIRRLRRFAGKPLWFARLIHWLLTMSPRFYVDSVGTCGLTFAPQPSRDAHGSVEGDWYDWFFPTGPTTVAFCIGGVKKEPAVDGDAIVVRRVMRVTGMMDNFVLSGFTAAQLASDFRNILENGEFAAAELMAAGGLRP
jgi:pyruvate/2-oxoglutarate dehydrogenase complex dihydrolipoamide acyltransferase (E2) component